VQAWVPEHEKASWMTGAEEETNRKDAVQGRSIGSHDGAADGEAIHGKTLIELGISVKRMDFKLRERKVGASGLISSRNWGEPGREGDNNGDR
jgi:hypothetical protein